MNYDISHNEQNSEIRCTVCPTPWFRHNFWTSCWMPKNYKRSQMFSMQRVFGKILGVSSLWLVRLPAAFVAKFMSIYKKFLIATFGWGCIWFYTKNFLCRAQFHCTIYSLSQLACNYNLACIQRSLWYEHYFDTECFSDAKSGWCWLWCFRKMQ